MKSILFCAGALLAMSAPASAVVLYKSVSATGTVEFSDLAPEKGRSVERIRIYDAAAGSGAPVTLASGPSREEQLRETDAAVTRANAQLDLAERALAEARRSVAGDSDPMRLASTLASTRLSRADQDRLEFYKKDVLLARAQLLEVLKEKRMAAAAPTLTASNEWTPFIPASRR